MSSEAVYKFETSHVGPSVVQSAFLRELGEDDILARWRRILEGRLSQIVAQLAETSREGSKETTVHGVRGELKDVPILLRPFVRALPSSSSTPNPLPGTRYPELCLGDQVHCGAALQKLLHKPHRWSPRSVSPVVTVLIYIR